MIQTRNHIGDMHEVSLRLFNIRSAEIFFPMSSSVSTYPALFSIVLTRFRCFHLSRFLCSLSLCFHWILSLSLVHSAGVRTRLQFALCWCRTLAMIPKEIWKAVGGQFLMLSKSELVLQAVAISPVNIYHYGWGELYARIDQVESQNVSCCNCSKRTLYSNFPRRWTRRYWITAFPSFLCHIGIRQRCWSDCTRYF